MSILDTDQYKFLNRLRSLWNIDGHLLPELTEEQQRKFVADPARYFMRAGDEQADAIWREIERRQKLSVSARGPTNEELLAAVRAFVAWLDAEEGAPDYGTLTRDTHPMGEQIWRQWFDNNIALCDHAHKVGRAALAKAEGR